MTFKKLVKLMSEVETRDDLFEVCGEIDKAFNRDKITWNDHEMLYKLADMVTYKKC